MPTYYTRPRQLQDIGTATNNAQSATTTISFTGTAKPKVGDTIFAYFSRDNITNDPATGDTFTDAGSNTYTVIERASPAATSTAQAGIVGGLAYSVLTAAWPAGTNTFTWNHPNNASSTAHALRVEHWTGIGSLRASSSGTGGSTAGVPSAATGATAPVLGDLVMGMAAFEHATSSTITGDADTTNGAWSAISAQIAGGGSNLTGAKVTRQYKTVTAGGAQTYNPTNSTTTSVDAVAVVASFTPASTSTFTPDILPWDELHWASDPGWTPPSDGSEVTSWRDMSGLARTMTNPGGSGPTFRSTEALLNNKPVVQFDGTNDYLVNSTSYTRPQPFTLVTVLAEFSTPTNTSRLVAASANGVQIFLEGGGWANSYTIYAGTNTPELNEHDSAIARVYSTLFNGVASFTTYDGVNSRPAPTTPGTGSITSGPTLGQRSTLDSPGAFKLAFFGVYPGDIRTDPNYGSFIEWIGQTYNLISPVLVQTLGSGIGTAAATTTTISFNSLTKPEVGDFVVFYGARDSAAGDAVTDSFSDGAGNTYTVLTNVAGTGATGVVTAIAFSKITTAWAAGANTLTWTHPSVTARALIGDHWKNVEGFRTGTDVYQDLTDGATSSVTNTGALKGDLVLGCAAGEWGSDVAPTVISTTHGGAGSWSDIRFKGNGVASASGIKVASQWKVIDANGSSQEWDVGGWGATTGSDVAALIAAFIPTTGGSAVAANLIAGTALYQPAVVPGSVTVGAQLISGTVLYQPAVTTLATVVANHLGPTATLYQPAAVPGSVTVVANHLGPTSTRYSPAVMPGSVTVGANHISATALHQPAVATLTTVGANLISTTSLFQPAVTPGQVSVAANLIATTALFQPAAVPGQVAVGANLITTTALYEPSVVAGAQTVEIAGTNAAKLIVPLYDYPSFGGSGWDTIATDPPHYVVANPASGPGASPNSDYTREIDQARAAGAKVLGYVNTMDVLGDLDTLDLVTVTDDIDDWYSFYNIDGIFFDLVPTGALGDRTAFCQDIADHVATHGADQFTVANPGTWPLAAGYLDPFDVTCVWEGHFTNNGYLASEVPGYAVAYARSFPPDRLLHLTYGATSGEWQSALDHAWYEGAGWFAATDEATGLWLDLATYHASLVDATSVEGTQFTTAKLYRPAAVPGAVSVATNLISTTTLHQPAVAVVVGANHISTTALHQPAVGYRVATNLISTTALHQPAVVPGQVSVATNLIATTVLAQPAVVPGALSVAANLISTTNVRTPAVAPGQVTIGAQLISGTTLFQQAAGYRVATNLIAATNVRTPAVAPGAVTVVANHLGPTAVVRQHTVVDAATSVVAANHISITALFQPAVAVGAVTVGGNHIAGTALYQPGAYALVAHSHLGPTSAQFPLTVVPGQVTVVVGHIGPTASLQSHAVTPGPVSVGAQAISSTTLFSPTVVAGEVVIAAGTIATTAVYTPSALAAGSIATLGFSTTLVHAPSVKRLPPGRDIALGDLLATWEARKALSGWETGRTVVTYENALVEVGGT